MPKGRGIPTFNGRHEPVNGKDTEANNRDLKAEVSFGLNKIKRKETVKPFQRTFFQAKASRAAQAKNQF